MEVAKGPQRRIYWAVDDSDRKRDILKKRELKAFVLFRDYLAELGSPTMEEFGRHTGRTRQSVSLTLKILEAKGYIKRLPPPPKKKKPRRHRKSRKGFGSRIYTGVITLPLDIFTRLQDRAVPFKETPCMVIRRVLDELDSYEEKEQRSW